MQVYQHVESTQIKSVVQAIIVFWVILMAKLIKQTWEQDFTPAGRAAAAVRETAAQVRAAPRRRRVQRA